MKLNKGTQFGYFAPTIISPDMNTWVCVALYIRVLVEALVLNSWWHLWQTQGIVLSGSMMSFGTIHSFVTIGWHTHMMLWETAFLLIIPIICSFHYQGIIRKAMYRYIVFQLCHFKFVISFSEHNLYQIGLYMFTL